jgi:hypothetical protein
MINEVSVVDKGAGENCTILLMKRDKEATLETVEKILSEKTDAEVTATIKDHAAAVGKSFGQAVAGRDADPICKALFVGLHDRYQERQGIAVAKRKAQAQADSSDGTKAKAEGDHGGMKAWVSNWMKANPKASREQANAAWEKSPDFREARKADAMA